VLSSTGAGCYATSDRKVTDYLTIFLAFQEKRTRIVSMIFECLLLCDAIRANARLELDRHTTGITDNFEECRDLKLVRFTRTSTPKHLTFYSPYTSTTVHPVQGCLKAMGSGRVLLTPGNVAQLSTLIDHLIHARTSRCLRPMPTNANDNIRHTAVIREADLKLGVEPGFRRATWCLNPAAIGSEFCA